MAMVGLRSNRWFDHLKTEKKKALLKKSGKEQKNKETAQWRLLSFTDS